MIAIGKTYGVPSASIFLRGGPDRELHAGGGGGGRGAAFAVPADCEAGADHRVETVRPAGPERAVDGVWPDATAAGPGNSGAGEGGGQAAGGSRSRRGRADVSWAARAPPL